MVETVEKNVDAAKATVVRKERIVNSEKSVWADIPCEMKDWTASRRLRER